MHRKYHLMSFALGIAVLLAMSSTALAQENAAYRSGGYHICLASAF